GRRDRTAAAQAAPSPMTSPRLWPASARSAIELDRKPYTTSAKTKARFKPTPMAKALVPGFILCVCPPCTLFPTTKTPVGEPSLAGAYIFKPIAEKPRDYNLRITADALSLRASKSRHRKEGRRASIL